MIIDCISDLHGNFPELKGGDLLIVAGDLTAKDTLEEIDAFDSWLNIQEYRKKIFITGNHDNILTNENPRIYYMSFKSREGKDVKKMERLEYLCDSGTEFEGLKIWGSPWTKRFIGMNPDCKAFTVDTEEELAEKWALIPDDTDILITHGPSYGMHDTNMFGVNCGSTSLSKWISHHVDSLKLHVHGHIHEAYGVYNIRKFQKKLGDPLTPAFVNASIVDEWYRHTNKPIRVIL